MSADESEEGSTHRDGKRRENGSGDDVGEPVRTQVEASQRDDDGDRHGEEHQKAFAQRLSEYAEAAALKRGLSAG